jgi:hypothetical protein
VNTVTNLLVACKVGNLLTTTLSNMILFMNLNHYKGSPNIYFLSIFLSLPRKSFGS